jgi:hypothetical protein
MGLRHGAYCLGCCWLLMGNSVRGRGDEPSLDRRAQRVRAVGEDHSPRILGGQGCRAFLMGLGGWMALSDGA